MGQARMEAAMTYQDRDSHGGASGRDPRTERGLHPDPTLRATPRQAMWSWVATVAIVFILGIVFYGINAQRTNEGGRPVVTALPAPTTSAAPTAPEAKATTPAETTGQGGATDQTEPKPPAGGAPGNEGAR
jgi:hypothetical protein